MARPKACRRRVKQLGSWRFCQQKSVPDGGGVFAHRHTDIPRVLYYYTPANRINLDGDALLVGSDDANDVRHETLSRRGPHQAIVVVHLVFHNLVDKDIEGLPRRRSVQNSARRRRRPAHRPEACVALQAGHGYVDRNFLSLLHPTWLLKPLGEQSVES